MSAARPRQVVIDLEGLQVALVGTRKGPTTADPEAVGPAAGHGPEQAGETVRLVPLAPERVLGALSKQKAGVVQDPSPAAPALEVGAPVKRIRLAPGHVADRVHRAHHPSATVTSGTGP